MAKYTMEQKREAVRLYTIMGMEGTCYFNDTPIHNIRALCLALNISSQSLYRWAEVIEIEEDDLKNLAILEKAIKCNNEDWCKAYQPLSDSNSTCNALNVCDDRDVRLDNLVEVFIPFLNEKGEPIDDPHDYPSESYRTEPMTFKMGTTFFQTLAQGLGIQNYRMPLKQLYLTIGNELMKRSGLVENGVKKELRLD